MTYFKVRNDLSVATLSKICKEIREIVGAPVLIDVVCAAVNDVRISLMPPRSEEGYAALRDEIKTVPPHYLKIVGDLVWKEVEE